MKALLTENNKQEILKILKERKTKFKAVNMIFLIEDIRKYSVEIFDNKIRNSSYNFDKCIRVVDIDTDGFYITGRSDKSYLSDCITRLSQGTKHFLIALRSHGDKSHKDFFLSLRDEVVSNEQVYRFEMSTFLNNIESLLSNNPKPATRTNINFVQKQYHVLNNNNKIYKTYLKNLLGMKYRNSSLLDQKVPYKKIYLTNEMDGLKEEIKLLLNKI